jgi:hypothetical protein
MFLEDLTKLPYFIECNLILGLIEGIHIKVVQKKLLHWDLGRERSEWSKMHIQWASTTQSKEDNLLL